MMMKRHDKLINLYFKHIESNSVCKIVALLLRVDVETKFTPEFQDHLLAQQKRIIDLTLE